MRPGLAMLDKDSRGASLMMVLVFTGAFVIILGGVTQYTIANLSFSRQRVDREYAFTVAEAGANYYRWHLAHVPDDYQDGTGGPGPYVHDYRDAAGSLIGQYSLEITPPPSGSTVVKITSTGWLNRRPNLKRTVEIRMGIPSFSQYAVAANDVMRFGSGTEVFGPIHSNNGIRFDALAHNLVTSSVDKYDDPDHGGAQEFGVHTHLNPVDPLPPAAVPTRTDVFQAGRSFPVAPVDFNGITADLSSMKSKATAAGIWLGPSGGRGYHITFRTNDTVDIRRVDTLRRCQYRYFSFLPWTDYADVFSVSTESSFIYQGASSLGVALPANGIIFAEDDVWVDGQVDGARMTVVAAREPLASANATIIFNNDLKYTRYDGSDAIGLIGQTNVSVGLFSEDNLQVDAALIAQKGRAGRYYYRPRPGAQFNPAGCQNNIYRNTLTLNGAIATNQRYGFAYTDGTGYQTRNLNFDNNLVFAPPPSFPTTGQYALLSWEEK